jgi:hypothetical protein
MRSERERGERERHTHTERRLTWRVKMREREGEKERKTTRGTGGGERERTTQTKGAVARERERRAEPKKNKTKQQLPNPERATESINAGQQLHSTDAALTHIGGLGHYARRHRHSFGVRDDMHRDHHPHGSRGMDRVWRCLPGYVYMRT